MGHIEDILSQNGQVDNCLLCSDATFFSSCSQARLQRRLTFFIVVWTFFSAILVGSFLFDLCKAYKMRSANPSQLAAANRRPRPAPSNARVFHQFSELHEDLMINILSYIADIPLEHPRTKPRSTVTGLLPLVSRQFLQFCNSDYFWQLSMKRMRLRDSYLWETRHSQFATSRNSPRR